MFCWVTEMATRRCGDCKVDRVFSYFISGGPSDLRRARNAICESKEIGRGKNMMIWSATKANLEQGETSTGSAQEQPLTSSHPPKSIPLSILPYRPSLQDLLPDFRCNVEDIRSFARAGENRRKLLLIFSVTLRKIYMHWKG